jgi:hypothetical protein
MWNVQLCVKNLYVKGNLLLLGLRHKEVRKQSGALGLTRNATKDGAFIPNAQLAS